MNGYDWCSEPIRISRNGESLVVPVSEVHKGDRVWMGCMEHTVYDVVPDDEEEIYYIGISPVDMWPAGCFVSGL